MNSPRSALIALLLSALALALPAGAAGSVSFDRPELITPKSPAGHPHQDARVAIAPDGTATVVWAETSYDDPAFNHAYVHFTRIGPGGEIAPTGTFDAGRAAAYYVDPAVAVDGSGRALIVFNDVGGTVHGVFVEADGTAGPVRELGSIDPSSYNGFAQAAFTPEGRAFASWTGTDGKPSVVALGADGAPGPVHEIEGGFGVTRLDMSAGPRLVWTRGPAEPDSGVFSAPLAADGAPGPEQRLIPPLTDGGSFHGLTVAGGRVLVGRRLEGDVDTGTVLTTRVDGSGGSTVLAKAKLPRGGNQDTGVDFTDLAIATRGGRSLATWTRKSSGDGVVGAKLKAAHINRAGDVRNVTETDWAGGVSIAKPAFVGGRALIVAAGDFLRAAEISPRGEVVDVSRLPGSRVKRARSLQLVPIGSRRARAVWEDGTRGNGGLIRTSAGTLR